MRISRCLVPLALPVVLMSCSVKEDRSGCPCVMELCVEGGETDRDVLAVWNPGLRLCDTLSRAGGTAPFEILVPRGLPVVSVWSGAHDLTLSGSVLRIPEGSQMEEVYAWTEPIDTRGEERVRVDALLHRQYAYLHINVVFQKGESSPYELRIRGNVDGLDLLSLEPVGGSFEFSFLPVTGIYHRVCLPRQNDYSLELDFIPRTPSRGLPEDSLPIGDYIRETGYDWAAPDLKDIFIDIDFVRTEVNLRVEDWEEGTSIGIII